MDVGGLGFSISLELPIKCWINSLSQISFTVFSCASRHVPHWASTKLFWCFHFKDRCSRHFVLKSGRLGDAPIRLPGHSTAQFCSFSRFHYGQTHRDVANLPRYWWFDGDESRTGRGAPVQVGGVIRARAQHQAEHDLKWWRTVCWRVVGNLHSTAPANADHPTRFLNQRLLLPATRLPPVLLDYAV